MSIYSDNLQNGFDNATTASHSLTNLIPARSSFQSIRLPTNGQPLVLRHSGLNLAAIKSLQFFVFSPVAGQRLTVELGDGTTLGRVQLDATSPNQWVKVYVTLSAFGRPNSILRELRISAPSNNSTFIDDIRFR